MVNGLMEDRRKIPSLRQFDEETEMRRREEERKITETNGQAEQAIFCHNIDFQQRRGLLHDPLSPCVRLSCPYYFTLHISPKKQQIIQKLDYFQTVVLNVCN